MMGKLHDRLKAIGYEGHRLELYLVRLVFCLFADDTTIFEKGIFYEFLDQRTAEDGSDLAVRLASLFEVLNTPEVSRLKNLDESLMAFPYVNGKLFEEQLSFASFDGKMRQTLLDCSALDWGKISPAIFGSLFQSVMDEKARRNLGAHYTSEKNILKLIKPLFLDALWEEYERVKGSRGKLQNFHLKISSLRFLDPACGCGNFLIIAYRELRLMELEIVKTLLFTHMKLREEVAATARMDIGALLRCDVDKFYGIEYEEFPAQIAQVAMWLIDHQMNMLVTEAFGEYYVRLPLCKSATIVHGNALRIDWQSLMQRDLKDLWNGEKDSAPLRFDYILGNPPFIGHQWRNEEQVHDMASIFHDAKRAGRLDYVAAWYKKAALYMQAHPPTVSAFVSTNSISQGEQIGILWKELVQGLGIRIHFAHRTFSWSNEGRGIAAVHVVIIGFGMALDVPKRLYEYTEIKGEPHEITATNINAYLVDGKDIFIESRGKPIHAYPAMMKGSQPTDGGHLLLNKEEKEELLHSEPDAEQWIRRFVGGYEFINNEPRFCLWLEGILPNELRSLPVVKGRVELVKAERLKSPTPSVRLAALTPTLFTQIRQPTTPYLVVPEVSSENRRYIPIGFMSPDDIASNKLQIIPNASLYLFGQLNSQMHMCWTEYVCGRMKSDYSYSPSVYHNYPFPQNPSAKNIQAVETAAQKVLDARAAFPDSSLADLYDPLTMPTTLAKAHAALDKAVDVCYRRQPFPNEAKRMEFLFELYDKYTAGMFAEAANRKKVRSSSADKP